MKKTAVLLALCFALFSCKKENHEDPTPAPVNNGPIGGTYTLTGVVSSAYDTIPGSGIVTIHEYHTTCTNLKGSTSITATSINSKGLMYDFATTGTQKEVVTA